MNTKKLYKFTSVVITKYVYVFDITTNDWPTKTKIVSIKTKNYIDKIRNYTNEQIKITNGDFFVNIKQYHLNDKYNIMLHLKTNKCVIVYKRDISPIDITKF